MEKLQLYACIPFMLYMPYSTLYVQENTSKDQKSAKEQKPTRHKRVSRLKRVLSRANMLKAVSSQT